MAQTEHHGNGPARVSLAPLPVRSTRATHSQTWLILGVSTLAGLLLAIVWSFEFADSVLGSSLANTALGTSAADIDLDLANLGSGLLFAFAAGLGATFTACNVVAFSCIAPLLGEPRRRVSIVNVVLLMLAGVCSVTAAYGLLGALMGRSVPILSSAKLAIGSGDGYPVRLAQSTVVFVVLGAIFVTWGLHSLQLIPNPLARIGRNRAWITAFGIGMLVGLFTVGRPFPLFRRAFEYAVDSGSPLFSAAAMAIQGLGNITVMIAFMLLLVFGPTGSLLGRLRERPQVLARITAVSMIVGGAFLISYWGVRVPSYFGIGWFPHMPYR